MINAVARPGDVSHTMALYRDSRERTEAWQEFARAGAAAGQAVLIAAPRGHLDGLDVGHDEQPGTVWLADLTTLGANPGRVLSMLRKFARDRAGRPVRIVQDVGWLGRPDEELAEAIRYEALLCQALRGCAAQVLCGYDERRGAAALDEAERLHLAAAQDSAAAPEDAGSFGAVLSRPPGDASTLTFRDDQAAVREFAAGHARLAGLPASRVTDLVIAVGELAGNTLRHTSGAGTLTIWTAPDEIVCEVRDEGTIGDPLAGTLRPDPAATSSHRGLWLVNQVSDLVQIRSGPSGTTVRVHLRLPGHGSTGAADAGAVPDRHQLR